MYGKIIHQDKYKTILEIPRADWITKGQSLFGKDMFNWIFKCSNCGHFQSVKSVVEHNPLLKKEECLLWVHCVCEGWHTEGYGCDWALYGIFHNHTREVYTDKYRVYVFEFKGE